MLAADVFLAGANITNGIIDKMKADTRLNAHEILQMTQLEALITAGGTIESKEILTLKHCIDKILTAYSRT